MSNRFDLEWPPRSGRFQSFPEVDRVAWFSFAEARQKIAKRLARLTLWKLRDMRRRLHRPRTFRLPMQARMLKSVVAEAHAPGLVPAPPEPGGGSRQRRAG